MPALIPHFCWQMGEQCVAGGYLAVSGCYLVFNKDDLAFNFIHLVVNSFIQLLASP
ncbi:hypothetical protein [Alteribacter natronophilus]|uniref:hypothetical protein n=1 Tax=Alteribacter natronophilus TaxID=2583810 RepID=UPI001486D647|nr:hypothetical protein [Alteribacter natronophilus]